MRNLLYIIFAFLLVICTGCPSSEDEKYIYIQNNSSKSIYCFAHSTCYPDTSLHTSDANKINNKDFYKVQPNEKKPVYVGNNKWEGVFGTAPMKTVMFFILDAETIENTPWDTVMEKYLVLRRLDLKIEDIDSTNWIINYP
jgi:hypothetical protein